MNQLFKKLENFTFSDMVNRTLSVPDLISVNFNLTDLRLEGWSVDPNHKLVDLVGNDRAIVSFKDFKGALKANYMFVTDPPLLADIGSIDFENYNVSISFDGYTAFVEDDFEANLLNFTLDIDPFIMHFDGISDTSDVVSRFLTFAGNIIRDRLVSLTHYGRTLKKVNSLINAVIDIIPEELHIPGTDLYLSGGLAHNFKIKKNSYIMLPLDVSL